MTAGQRWTELMEPDADRELWRPVVIDARRDAGALEELLAGGRVTRVHDTLRLQLRDLADARCPEVELAEAQLDAQVEELLDGRPIEEHGRWVFYPWSGRLVHLLAPVELRELRLDRNRHKITADEAARLWPVTIGIAGLSVGNAIALTLALEGTFGHLRLADFDRLDLSNMNRLRAAVHEIGLRKTVLAARQIAEIDPYAEVSLLHDGITEDNVDRFLDGDPELGPALDVVIDECDSLYVKFLLRERARARRLPVLMETSDRGLLDVERFDLEPERPLFHGLVPGVDAAAVRALDVKTPEARERKGAMVVRLLEGAMLSTRMAASMLEVDTSISTWPQLASDVVLGGASTTVAVRRLALGELLPSGRRYVDLERAVASDTPAAVPPSEDARRPALRPALGAAHPGRVDAVPEEVREIVAHATLAPSGGNVQPWHFLWGNDRLWVVHDTGRSRNLLDVNSHATWLALGAAVENGVIAAAHRGLAAEVEPFPVTGDARVAAALALRPARDGDVTALAGLRSLVEARRTDRRLGPRVDLPAPDARALVEAAAGRNGELELVTDADAMEEVGRIVGVSDRVRMLCRETHRELVGELRWTAEEAQRTRDGLTVSSLELSAAGTVAVELLTRPDVAAFLRRIEGARGVEELAWDSIAAASAVGLLSVPADTPPAWLAGGRAMQRLWLESTARGLGIQPLTVVLYQLEMLRGEGAEAYMVEEKAELGALEERLFGVFRRPAGAPALLFRVNRLAGAPERSLRLPAEWVLSAGVPEAAE